MMISICNIKTNEIKVNSSTKRFETLKRNFYLLQINKNISYKTYITR